MGTKKVGLNKYRSKLELAKDIQLLKGLTHLVKHMRNLVFKMVAIDRDGFFCDFIRDNKRLIKKILKQAQKLLVLLKKDPEQHFNQISSTIERLWVYKQDLEHLHTMYVTYIQRQAYFDAYVLM